tara:strand:- start:1632 stop:4286 length:2655 start_codon:yes stop_codon:yes gene_type:complete
VFELVYPATEAVVGRVINFAQRRAWFVIVFALGAAIATAQYTAKHFAINTNTEEMLSEKLPWRMTFSDYKNDFPYFSDTIVIVIDGATPDTAKDAAAQLAERLRKTKSLVRSVYYPSGDYFLRRHQLLYASYDDLESLTDKLSEAQPFLARLSRNRSSASLFDLLNDGINASLRGEAIDIASAVEQIAFAIDQLNGGNNIPMSWQALIMGDDADRKSGIPRINREIIIIQPTLDFSALLPAEPVINVIKEQIADLKLDRQHGFNVRLTGPAALSYDELTSVITGSQDAALLALIMIISCLLIGLRSLSLVIATLISLLVGLIFTAGFAIAWVGTLNMISIAFAVLYVGLGVDFAIHICLRYREMLRNTTSENALHKASQHVGLSLILCAMTTAIGFFSFIPTAYQGVAELGLIAGCGMLVSLIVSIGLLPALLHVLPTPKIPSRTANFPDGFSAFPRENAKAVLAVATVLWCLAALCIPLVQFDVDPINLNDQTAESVVTYRALRNNPETSPTPVAAVVDSHTIARDLIDHLKALPEVSTVRFIESFIPDNQDKKLALIDDLALLLGPDLELSPEPVLDDSLTLNSIQTLLNTLRITTKQSNQSELSSSARLLMQALTQYHLSIKSAGTAERARTLQTLEQKLLGSFDGRLIQLRDSLSPEPIATTSLPKDIRRRWLSDNGHYRIEAYPAGDIGTTQEMKLFVAAARTVLGDRATGTPVINLAASNAVKLAFIEAFSYAFIVITLLLWLILRSIKEVSVVLSPLVLAGLLTSATSVVLAIPFNFANIIALPLLLGIGVDSALHILHRYKTALPPNGNLLQTSTARAVFFSALTTTVSFGNLAGSAHAGTASMGVMLTIGVVSTLTCTLLVLPALLQLFLPRQTG